MIVTTRTVLFFKDGEWDFGLIGELEGGSGLIREFGVSTGTSFCTFMNAIEYGVSHFGMLVKIWKGKAQLPCETLKSYSNKAALREQFFKQASLQVSTFWIWSEGQFYLSHQQRFMRFH